MTPENQPANSEILEDTAQIGEAIVDSFLIEQIGNALNVAGENIELLQGIPVVGFIGTSYKALKKGTAWTMNKKLYKFLFQLSYTSENERIKFAEKLKNDKKMKERVVENLILILEKIDDIEKAKILGNLFVAYIKEKILYDDYHRLSAMISRVYVADLRELYKKHLDLSQIDLSIRKQLASDGFLLEHRFSDDYPIGAGGGWPVTDPKVAEQIVRDSDRKRFSITTHGQYFIDLNLYSN